MSLSKQMIIFITSLLLLVLSATFWLNLSNTKIFLESQLKTHAQDTATSLGLSLSSVANPEDTSSMDTMINAVFDRGYYSFIQLKDMDNHIIYARKNPQKINGIPSWFIQAISIHAPIATAVVQAGWSPIGTLQVQSHPGYAYIELWKATLNLLTLFALASIISILIALFVIKTLLKPLNKMEAQAEAIVKKEYIYQDNLPTTLEFRQVVTAMNAMVGKMKSVFDRDAKMAEKLQRIAYQDSVTKLSNRLHFEMQIDALLNPNSENLPGTLCLIRLEGLKELNEQFGYLIGDKIMLGLADALKQNIKADKALYARLNGTELIAVVPGHTGHSLVEQCQKITHSFTELLQSLTTEATTSIAIALMDYQPGDKRGALMAKLDFAIAEAKKIGINQVFYYARTVNQSQEDHQWLKLIDSAIQENRFTLFQQPAQTQQGKIHDLELLIRMKEPDGTIRSAGYFMPAITKLNKIKEIDQLVIKLALNYLSTTGATTQLAINLTRDILTDQTMVDQLIALVKQQAHQHLMFEISEELLIKSQNQAWPLMTQLQKAKIEIGIDHFGSTFGDMHYLQKLRPNYIKLDAAFTKGIDKDDQTQSYVSSLVEMANSLDITVIAMAVENEEQITAFSDLGITTFQGYYIGAPTPLK